jgi:starch-binding outer membrane protein, SusD/RagB family
MIMKRTILSITTLLVALSLLTSCDDWLAVDPKTQIGSDDNFQSEQGFKDALTGTYILMTGENVYGRQLTFGMVDVLGNQYSSFTANDRNYYQLSIFNYESDTAETMIDDAWKSQYNAIANVNNLIANVDVADPLMFENENYNIIRGEAYGLRAFLHFDLLRLFASAPSSGGTGAMGIPYVNTFGLTVTPSSTVGEVLDMIRDDLDVAVTALAQDPVIPGKTTTTSDNYLRDRSYKFNYYAAKALQARVALYANDKTTALARALEVIESNAFPFVPASQVVVGVPASANRVFTPELIFALNMTNLGTLSASWLIDGSLEQLGKTPDEYRTVYEVQDDATASDYRFRVLTSLVNTDRYAVKLDQPAGIPTAYANRMPVLRVSEMYYIAAECLKDTDPGRAIGYLNAVRTARGILDNLSLALTAEQIQEEIFKEYEKEFLLEGQLFYYYKRVNASSMRFSGAVAGDAVYVLPRPDNEIEFGQ